MTEVIMPFKVNAMLLCDYAQIREGLLQVVSGGIDRVVLANVPNSINVVVAAVISPSATCTPGEHQAVMVLHQKSGPQPGVLVRLSATVTLGSDIRPGSSIPMVFDFRGAELPAPGEWTVTLGIDGQRYDEVSFEAAIAGG